MRRDLEKLCEEFPNLKEFLEKKNDPYLLGLLVAHQFRRGRSRNFAVNYGTPTPLKTPFLNGPNRDLLWAYNRQLALEEADKTSEEIYVLLKELQLDATLILNEFRNPELKLTLDEKAEKLERLQDIEQKITELTDLLEKLSA